MLNMPVLHKVQYNGINIIGHLQLAYSVYKLGEVHASFSEFIFICNLTARATQRNHTVQNSSNLS